MCCSWECLQKEMLEVRQDLIQRVGSKSPLGIFTANLTAALMPGGWGPDVLGELAQLACPVNGSVKSQGAEMDEDEEGLASVDTTQDTGEEGQRGVCTKHLSYHWCCLWFVLESQALERMAGVWLQNSRGPADHMHPSVVLSLGLPIPGWLVLMYRLSS
jgi:hypothetical protein